MIGLLGKKVGMTQVFDKEGKQLAVTLLEVGPCTVLQVKKPDTDGYQAVQLGFSEQNEKHSVKAEIGHAKKANGTPKRFVREIRTESIEGLNPGTVLKVNNFAVGDWIDVVGTSIGRGFQGVVKRLHYKGGLSKSHGSMFGRVPGSIGAKAGGNGCRKKVRKGKGLPGHMGHERITTQNLRVFKIDVEQNLMAVAGPIPGPKEGYVVIKEAIKKRRKRNWRMPDAALEELKQVERKVTISAKKAKVQAADKAKAAAPAAKKK